IGTLRERQRCMPKSDSAEHEETISLLAEWISKLPTLQKKVLAMYYFESLSAAEIADSLGLSNLRICQTLTGTVDLLHTSFLEITSSARKIQREASPDPEAGSCISAAAPRAQVNPST